MLIRARCARHPRSTIIAFRPRTHRQNHRAHLINDQIRAKDVRLIDADGEQVGVVPLPTAMNAAADAGVDLVEVAPDARPPVCRIMDYGKYEYELAQKAKASRSRSAQLKEMKFRPGIGDHDYDTKCRKVTEFLEEGDRVRVTVQLRGREMRRPERAREMVDRIVEDLDDIADLDNQPKREGRQITAILVPSS